MMDKRNCLEVSTVRLHTAASTARMTTSHYPAFKNAILQRHRYTNLFSRTNNTFDCRTKVVTQKKTHKKVRLYKYVNLKFRQLLL